MGLYINGIQFRYTIENPTLNLRVPEHMCLYPRLHCYIARTFIITPLSTPTMNASICLLLVACTAFAAAAVPCNVEELRNMVVCPKATDVPEYEECIQNQAMALYKTCETDSSPFAQKFMACIVKELAEEKMEACVELGQTSVPESQVCYTKKINDAISHCEV